MTYLITGGSGCGKSTYAEQLIRTLPEENRFYIATMSVCDDECALRVKRHRAQRADMNFKTVECEKDLSAANVPTGAIVLLEDLVNLTANEMFSGGSCDRIIPALRSLHQTCEVLVIVTNDVFSDGTVYESETRHYQKTLSDINNFAASIADSVIEVVYSVPIAIKGVLPETIMPTKGIS